MRRTPFGLLRACGAARDAPLRIAPRSSRSSFASSLASVPVRVSTRSFRDVGPWRPFRERRGDEPAPLREFRVSARGSLSQVEFSRRLAAQYRARRALSRRATQRRLLGVDQDGARRTALRREAVLIATALPGRQRRCRRSISGGAPPRRASRCGRLETGLVGDSRRSRLSSRRRRACDARDGPASSVPFGALSGRDASRVDEPPPLLPSRATFGLAMRRRASRTRSSADVERFRRARAIASASASASRTATVRSDSRVSLFFIRARRRETLQRTRSQVHRLRRPRATTAGSMPR